MKHVLVITVLILDIEAIEKSFPFFPRLHMIFASRPNVTPIAITTGLGPQGSKTVWYQPPDDEDVHIDPVLRAASRRPPLTPVRTSANAAPTPTPAQTPELRNHYSGSPQGLTPEDENVAPPTSQRKPKPSTLSRDALDRAYATVSKVPQKRSAMDLMLEMQRYVVCPCCMLRLTSCTASETRDALRAESADNMAFKKRTQLFEEFKVGLWTKDEY